jgi:hypothetical protein
MLDLVDLPGWIRTLLDGMRKAIPMAAIQRRVECAFLLCAANDRLHRRPMDRADTQALVVCHVELVHSPSLNSTG